MNAPWFLFSLFVCLFLILLITISKSLAKNLRIIVDVFLSLSSSILLLNESQSLTDSVFLVEVDKWCLIV